MSRIAEHLLLQSIDGDAVLIDESAALTALADAAARRALRAGPRPPCRQGQVAAMSDAELLRATSAELLAASADTVGDLNDGTSDVEVLLSMLVAEVGRLANAVEALANVAEARP